MVQGYYVLQEAAKVLGMSVDDLKALAQRNQIRSFQDRGTLRFRIQDIQEMQRQRLGNSDPELVLGDAVSPKPVPAGGPKTPAKAPKPASGVKPTSAIDFDDVGVGKEPLAESSSARKPKSGPKSGVKSPSKPGSDSDVKLVADSENFTIQIGDDLAPSTGDSDVRLGDLPAKKSGSSSRKSASGLSSSRRSKIGPSPADSGVRLVPMDDSGVRLDSAPTESDVRLDRGGSGRRLSETGGTEEIANLDEEIQKFEEKPKRPETKFQTTPSMFGKPGAAFELSEHDIDDKPTRASETSGSDFEIASTGAPAGASAGPKSSPPRSPKPKKKGTEFEMLPPGESDEDFSLELDEESLDLGAEPGNEVSAPKSGINLSHPSDKGISLEAPASDDDDFELSIDEPTTPTPAKKPADDDSDFELSLDDDSTETSSLDDDSEFELDLDDTAPGADLDDSDFELALDDVDTDEGSAKKPAKKGKGKAKPKKTAYAKEGELFDTEGLPSLDEDYGSGEETVDADSSDFELALDDTDIGAEDESGSQVVALDEEDYEEGADTHDADLDDYEEGDIEEEEEAEQEIVERVVVQEVIRERWIKPAPWGVLPTVFMVPCLIAMIFVGIMGWELVQTSSGYRSSGVVTKWVAEKLDFKPK